MPKLTVVVAQINLLVGDIKNNAQRIIETSQEAVKKYKADIVLFPELALSSYPPEDLLLRPGFYIHIEKALADITKSIKNTTIIVGYPEKKDENCYNKAAVIQNRKIIATYAKHLLPNYTVFDEMRYFTPGTTPCVVDIKGVKIGVTICEDLWHDGPAKESVNAGAQIILSLNASPYDRNKVRARQNMLEERVKQVHVPIVYCNLVGGQDELVFDGGSMVVDAAGNRIQQAPYYKETLIPIEISSGKNVTVTPQALPERLTEEQNIYQALVLGIYDYVNKNNFSGVLLGLSGGIDSALTLALAYDALGPERIHTIMMPSRFTSKASLIDSKEQAETLNVEYDVIKIDDLFNNYLHTLKKQFEGACWSSAEENIQARIRSNLLMAISNKKGYMVLATGNKSEMSVGYTTLYGDMSGGFAPLKDIPKTMIYRLAQYRNSIAPANINFIPERVIEREPSAELAEAQKDQDTLPPYEVLDEILSRYIEKDQEAAQIYAAGFDTKVVDKVIRMISQSEYKRHQAPVGIRTTQRAFGKDRRYPITSGYTRNLS